MRFVSYGFLISLVLVLVIACSPAPAAPPAATTKPASPAGQAAPTTAPAAPAGQAAPTTAAAAPAGSQITFKLGHVLAPTHPFQIGMLKTADLLSQKTNGAVKIEVFPSSQLGTERDMEASIKTGGVDMMLASPGGASVLLPELAVLDAPYLFRDDAHWKKVVEGDIAKGWNDKMVKQEGVRVVGWFHRGTRHAATRTKPLNTINDIQGMKVRVADLPLYPAVFKAFGANPTPIAFAEMYQALATGTVDGADTPLDTFLSSKLNEVTKYLNLIAWSYAAPGPVLMSDKSFQKLTPAQQEALISSVQAGTDEIFNLIVNGDKDNLKKISDLGVTVVTPTDLPEWRKRAVEKAVPELTNTWGGDAKLYDTIASVK